MTQFANWNYIKDSDSVPLDDVVEFQLFKNDPKIHIGFYNNTTNLIEYGGIEPKSINFKDIYRWRQ